MPLAVAVGRYVFEPNPAVLAAGLESTLAAEHRLAALTVEASYLTGDAPVDDAALAVFAVTDVLPFDTKHLRAVLRAHGIGRLEVKKRGAGVVLTLLVLAAGVAAAFKLGFIPTHKSLPAPEAPVAGFMHRERVPTET